jgi:hypothetical protein
MANLSRDDSMPIKHDRSRLRAVCLASVVCALTYIACSEKPKNPGANGQDTAAVTAQRQPTDEGVVGILRQMETEPVVGLDTLGLEGRMNKGSFEPFMLRDNKVYYDAYRDLVDSRGYDMIQAMVRRDS